MKNYSNPEIKRLVEEYEEKRHRKGVESDGRLLLLVKHLDLWAGMRRLSPPEYEAVLLCGLLGLTARTAGVLVGASADTMNRRYKRGLISLARNVNNAIRR
jgi:DNA-directed RNA polymerase specialized sigma24 family protein